MEASKFSRRGLSLFHIFGSNCGLKQSFGKTHGLTHTRCSWQGNSRVFNVCNQEFAATTYGFTTPEFKKFCWPISTLSTFKCYFHLNVFFTWSCGNHGCACQWNDGQKFPLDEILNEIFCSFGNIIKPVGFLDSFKYRIKHDFPKQILGTKDTSCR